MSNAQVQAIAESLVIDYFDYSQEECKDMLEQATLADTFQEDIHSIYTDADLGAIIAKEGIQGLELACIVGRYSLILIHLN